MESALADLTYDLFSSGLFNTPGLHDAVTVQARHARYAFQPGIDHDVFYPRSSGELPDLRRMFFYGRPDVARNGFCLGMNGLQMTQQEYPDSEVHVAGHPRHTPHSGLRGEFRPTCPTGRRATCIDLAAA